MATRRRNGSQSQGDSSGSQASDSSSRAANGSAHPPARPIRIAVIGSGLTGLSASYYLAASSSAQQLDVHLFEKGEKIGLDGSSIDVSEAGDLGRDHRNKRNVRIDVPMRSLNGGAYPSVMKLYRQLGIPLRRSNFTFSFATEQKQNDYSTRDSSTSRVPSPAVLYEGSSGVRGFTLPASLRSNPSTNSPSNGSLSTPAGRTLHFYRHATLYTLGLVLHALGYLYILTVSLYHHYLGHTRDPNHPIYSQTLQGYFDSSSSRFGLSTPAFIKSRFLQHLLVPLFSAMMTAQASSVLACPVAELMDYVSLTFGRSHYVVAAGVKEVEKTLTRNLGEDQIHVDCAVTKVQLVPPKSADKSSRHTITIVVDEKGQTRTYEGFDHVILATQANQSSIFVESYLESSEQLGKERLRKQELLTQLKRFTYEDAWVVNHTDRSLLPRDESDWRDLNLISPMAADVSHKQRKLGSNGKAHAANGYGSAKSSDTRTMASHLLFRPSTPSSTIRKVADQQALSPQAKPAGAEVLIQTTNPLAHLSPREDTILSTSHFQRAVCSLSSKSGQKGLFEWVSRGSGGSSSWLRVKEQWTLKLGHLQGRLADHDEETVLPGIWLCGSWSPGIPLLEGCVVSSKLVIQALLESEGLPTQSDAHS